MINIEKIKECGSESGLDDLYKSTNDDLDDSDILNDAEQDSNNEKEEEDHLQYMLSHVENEYQSSLLYKINASVVPSREENLELVVKAQSGDKKAMEDLIIRNGRLVTKYLARFRHLNFGAQEDLLQEGLLGIQRAAISFDPSPGCSFSTYAMYWIRQKMVRYVQCEYGTIRFPVHIEEKRLQIRKLQLQYDEPLSREDIAKKLDFSLSTVNAIMDGNRPISLDERVSHEHVEDRPMTFLDTLKSNENIASNVEDSTANQIIMDLLNRYLTEIEKDVLLKRFGFYDGIPHTLKEIGDMRGISRERVRQVQKNAINKLRDPFKRRDMAAFFNICV